MSTDSSTSTTSADAVDSESAGLDRPGPATTRQLHGLLIEAMRASHGDALDEPVTVAEIYQDLVPYRDVRDELGLGLNADYEYAVLRLLAGEEGEIRVEPEEVRARLGAELESPNPDVGLFRQFAACDVRIRVPPADKSVAKRGGSGSPTGQAATTARAAEDAAARSPAAEKTATAAPAAEGANENTRLSCEFCGRELPSDRDVRFCPFCGGDQDRNPCESCGEPLDRGWAYCVACGTAVAAA